MTIQELLETLNKENVKLFYHYKLTALDFGEPKDINLPDELSVLRFLLEYWYESGEYRGQSDGYREGYKNGFKEGHKEGCFSEEQAIKDGYAKGLKRALEIIEETK